MASWTALIVDTLRTVWEDRELRLLTIAFLVSAAFMIIMLAPATAFLGLLVGYLTGVLLSELTTTEGMNVKIVLPKQEQVGESSG